MLKQEKLFNHILDASIDAILIINTEGTILEWNKSAEKLLKYKKKDILNRSIFLLIPEEFKKFTKNDLVKFNKTKISTWKNQVRLLEIINKHQEKLLVEVSITPFKEKEEYFLTIILRDKQEKTHQKIIFNKSYYFTNILNNIHQEIYRAKSKSEFLNIVCKKIVTTGKYQFSWFGIVKKKPKKKIIPIFQYGRKKSFLKKILLNINDSKNDFEPISNTIKEKKPTIINSIQSDIKNKKIIDEATKQGFTSLISLPIFIENSMYGVLNIFSEKENNFNNEEIQFFNQIALEIELGITIINEKRIKKVQEKKLAIKSFEVKKRLKELNCLYGISKIIENKDFLLEEILQKIANIIPAGFQHPKKVSCQITHNSKTYFSQKFKPSHWHIIHEIKSQNKIIGNIVIYHHHDNQSICENLFLDEEKHLILRVKERLSRLFDYHKIENEVSYLTQILMKVQESNNIKIASIIHDDLGQSLYALKLKVQSLNLSKEEEEEEAKYKNIINLTDDIIEHARSLSHNLAPISLQSLNFTDTIKELIDTTERLNQFEINLELDIFSKYIKNKWDINLFRIVQEALHNIVKHSKAKTIDIISKKENDFLILNIIDDGNGFSDDYLEKNKKALGLFLMRERAAILGGKISYKSIKQKGVNIELKIPIPKT